MIYSCCDRRRRELVLGSPLNGIDFLEVSSDQRTLDVHFLKPLTGALTGGNVRIEGGERLRAIAISGVTVGTGGLNKVLRVSVEAPGDFSPYVLSIVKAPDDSRPPDGFDPILSSIEFSFKVACPVDHDCRPDRTCPPPASVGPEIDYLAKDYASFRQLMLDRLAVLAPRWTERNPADLGVALVELLAYVGDYLSYHQDAVATEAYLGTARLRTSLRRHARLVDYVMHDGCNARAWVHLEVRGTPDPVTLPKGTRLFTRVPGVAPRIQPDSAEHRKALSERPEVFEAMHDATLREAHNQMRFHTWGDDECCLPRGAARATLVNDGNRLQHLKTGDVLIFEEVLGPTTGESQDADPTHRHAVRLTRATFANDPLFSDGGQPLGVVEVEWASADALPFPLCLWEVDGPDGKKQPVSVARGNIVLADHGATIAAKEPLSTVPTPAVSRTASGGNFCDEVSPRLVYPRFRPRLRRGPLTQVGTVLRVDPVTRRGERVPFDPDAPAAAAFQWDVRNARPAVHLDDEQWKPRRDLLSSGRFEQHFVVETEEGRATLRFGDDRHGKRPPEGALLQALYRVGNGTRGNVGRETIDHVVTGEPAITAVRNPLPAGGGLDPESREQVLRGAPSAFRTQERAVTADDYAAAAERHGGVQRAAATFRWTGSWHTVFVTADRLGGERVDEDFEDAMRRHLERFRMAGHDLEVDAPSFVSLEIAMRVCVKPEYFRGDVRSALSKAFSSRDLADGRRGLFHPDNFTFGQPVFLSPLYAAAQAVDGVESVEITTFQRQGIDSEEGFSRGALAIGRLEIARLDNDPNFPERGVFRLTVEGGK